MIGGLIRLSKSRQENKHAFTKITSCYFNVNMFSGHEFGSLGILNPDWIQTTMQK